MRANTLHKIKIHDPPKSAPDITPLSLCHSWFSPLRYPSPPRCLYVARTPSPLMITSVSLRLYLSNLCRLSQYGTYVSLSKLERCCHG
jgi:hypothetical protein